MFKLEDTYWWFVGRRQLVRELLLRHRPQSSAITILDLGCGTGATLKEIEDLGTTVGIDRSSDALHFCRLRGLRNLALGDAHAVPVATNSVDAILALDLLEHIKDDVAAAQELARVLQPGGVLVATVPACPELWSEHDEALDHIRRYRATRLRNIIENAGFDIERISPVISALLLPIALLRLIQRILPRKKDAPETAFIIPPPPVNWALIMLLKLERLWLRRFNLPIGVSLFVVARKPAH